MSSSESSRTLMRLRKALDQLECSSGGTYELQRDELRAIRLLLHEFLAERFQPVLNEHLATLPQDTTQEKQALARHVNEELRHLGLSLQDKAGEQSILRARQGKNYVTGRFEVERVGPYRIQTMTSGSLFPLKLMPAAPPRVGRGEGHGR